MASESESRVDRFIEEHGNDFDRGTILAVLFFDIIIIARMILDYVRFG